MRRSIMGSLLLALAVAACGKTNDHPVDGGDRFAAAGTGGTDGAAGAAGGAPDASDGRPDATDGGPTDLQPRPDAGPDADASDGGGCPPPSEPIFGCPTTFTAHDRRGCLSSGGFQSASWAGTCGAYQIDYSYSGLDTIVCAYDAQGTLVAARRCTDHNVLSCGQGGFCYLGGQLIDFGAQCDLDGKLLCPGDGGADAKD